MCETFKLCSNITTISNITTNNVVNFTNMFYGCLNLQNVPIFNMGKAGYNSLRGMYTSCQNLTNQSIYNIIDSLLTLPTSFTSGKNLRQIGFDNSQVNVVVNYTNWNILESNGWITGF